MASIDRAAGRVTRRFIPVLAACAALLTATGLPAHAAGESGVEIRKQEWTFAGIFGQYDQAQLQRGFKVYEQACSNCHSMRLVPFRTLTDESGPNFTEDEAQAIASAYTVTDISNETGQPFDREAKLTDTFPSPYPNKAAATATLGAYPPDFSLIAKARAAHRGFPGFVVDAFANYAENGPDYIYALLLGYQEAPEDVEPVQGAWYNPVFMSGNWIKMPQPVQDGQISYPDGSPETVEQYAADISAFLMWAAEPKLEERKEIGFRVMVFLAVLGVLLYMTKRRIWRNVAH